MRHLEDLDIGNTPSPDSSLTSELYQERAKLRQFYLLLLVAK